MTTEQSQRHELRVICDYAKEVPGYCYGDHVDKPECIGRTNRGENCQYFKTEERRK